MKNQLQFPKGFLWGAATSSHQIEGGQCNDWSRWENSDQRVSELKSKGCDPYDYASGMACNSFQLFDRDLECLQKINAKAYRFSIEWSRIEPVKGEWSEEGLQYYRGVISKLKAANIVPFVTLWHFSLPVWAADEGGWASAAIIDRYCRYVEKVVGELKDDVKFWCTLNEPDIYAGYVYLRAAWPGSRKYDLAGYFRCFRNMVSAHRNVFALIKKIDVEAQVGIAKHNIYFEAYRNKLVNVVLKKIADWWWNYLWLNLIRNHEDYIGLNHYNHNRVNYGFNKNENKMVAEEMGWEICPESMYHALMDLKKYGKPVYILENGIADGPDKYREYFITESLKGVHRAISEGVDVRGYFYWSLLDNLELARGWDPKFGLFAVDRKTFVRTMRPSAEKYAEICRNNGL